MVWFITTSWHTVVESAISNSALGDALFKVRAGDNE